MRIALSADHAGVDLKDLLARWLSDQGHDIVDLGTHGHESVDYPRFGALLAKALADGKAERGITVCGSGIGVAIAANRNRACRCAQVAEPLSATLARQHNNANAIALGARLIGPEMAIACVNAFLTTDFLGGRHERRVEQLSHPSTEQEPA
jgi:ribose 5-phosphate isomerase B